MNYPSLLAVLAIGMIANQVAVGQQPPPTKPATTGSLIYKAEPRRRLYIYYPENWKASDKRSALVIFRCNIPYQREHFRKLGMVIIKPQTAGVNSGKLPGMTLEEIAVAPKPRHQVEDTKSAIRYLRQNADTLGIDPQRIVATGTSGGGDLALLSQLNTAFEDPTDDPSVSHRPNALLLYCPAFDGINIWFVKTETLVARTKADAPSFLPLLTKFVESTTDEYAQPLDHRAKLIERAAEIGAANQIGAAEIKSFQATLELFNERDWQLLHPAEDALRMSASRLLTKQPLPPTMILYGDRDHLRPHQLAFVKHARSLGHKFELREYQGGGHSFMTQPAFMETSTRDAEAFLSEIKMLPSH